MLLYTAHLDAEHACGKAHSHRDSEGNSSSSSSSNSCKRLTRPATQYNANLLKERARENPHAVFSTDEHVCYRGFAKDACALAAVIYKELRRVDAII